MSNAEAQDAHPYLPRVPGTDKRALITGISGQDGSYLAELLLEKGYEVRHHPPLLELQHGPDRPSTATRTRRGAAVHPLRRPLRLRRAGQAALRASAG